LTRTFEIGYSGKLGIDYLTTLMLSIYIQLKAKAKIKLKNTQVQESGPFLKNIRMPSHFLIAKTTLPLSYNFPNGDLRWKIFFRDAI